MLRSMFSAVAGLRAHQTMMDVTGNNVANVNTAGYKATRTTFSETLTQVTRGGTAGEAGADGAGGVNPMQLGLGSQIAATDAVFTQGASQVTGRSTDLAIQGEGFFQVEDAAGDAFYTRAGAFGVDNAGNLVNPEGMRVLGENGPIQIADGATDVAIGSNGLVTAKVDGVQEEQGQLQLANFANPGGLTRVGNGLFAAGPASGDAQVGLPNGDEGLGGLQSGTLEMSNVDLAQEFTNLILAQRGFQANSRTITTSDELLQELVNLKR